MPTYKYRCIGRGTTNNQGIAHITHNCQGTQLQNTGYKGTGAGQINILASTDTPTNINDDSFQSQTIEILDCLYYFTNTYTAYKNNSITVNPKTSSIEFTSNGSGLVYLHTDGSTFLHGNYAFEFKLIDFSTTNINIRCSNSVSTSLQRPLSDLGAEEGDTIRVENNGTTVYFYVNDVQTVTRSNNGTIRYGFSIPNGATIEVTDMKIYPI